jgi:hypothetical protein
MSHDSEFEEFSARQRSDASAVYDVWVKSLSPAQRALVDSLPDDEACSATISSVDCDVAMTSLASFRPDMAAEVDRLHDVLREDFCLSEQQSLKVAAWHLRSVLREAEGVKALQLSRIIAVLIRPMKAVRSVILGRALAGGLAGQLSLNGFHSGAEAARSLGKHRATLSYWKRHWQRLLDLRDETYGKSDLAKATYSKARRAVVARAKGKNL